MSATIPTSAAIETADARAHYERLLTEEPAPIYEAVCAELGSPLGVAS